MYIFIYKFLPPSANFWPIPIFTPVCNCYEFYPSLHMDFVQCSPEKEGREEEGETLAEGVDECFGLRKHEERRGGCFKSRLPATANTSERNRPTRVK